MRHNSEGTISRLRKDGRYVGAFYALYVRHQLQPIRGTLRTRPVKTRAGNHNLPTPP
jgi:hypothetical protein